jgi:hypothetical protein
MEKKGEAIGDLLEKIFSSFIPYIPYMTIFWYWGRDREAAEVALIP